MKKCVLCNEKIVQDFGKLKGTTIRSKNEKNVNELIYVCSECMKKDNWIENAKIKGA